MSISQPPTTTTTITTTTTTTTTTNSITTSTSSTATTNATILQSQTYWCHECDMSVLLLQPINTTFPPLCPHCHHDFLEQMDTSSNLTPPNPPTFYPPFTPSDTATTYTSPSDDNRYLQHLIHHLLTTTAAAAAATSTTNTTPSPQRNIPASKKAIESLNHIVVDSNFLEKDPSIVCPVCKDQFLITCEAKILPCKHTYHDECIVPWLEINNSCPVCRHRLPSEYDERRKNDGIQGRERNFIGEERLEELFSVDDGDDDDDDDDDYQDLFGIRSTLRNVVRRQQYNSNGSSNNNNNDEWDNEGVGGIIGDHLQRTNGVQRRLLSRPRRPVEGGAAGTGTGSESGSGSGDGESGVGVSTGSGNDEVGMLCDVLR